MSPMIILVSLGALGTVLMAAAAIVSRREAAALRARLKPVLDADKEAKRIKERTEASRRDAERDLAELHNQASGLRARYATAKQRFVTLDSEVRSLEENLEDIEAGFYRPHFTYEDSESYKAAIEETRTLQKELTKSGGATRCGTSWQVGGSKREGEKMVRQTEKLLLRAFNAEAEAAVSNVAWNNYETMRGRILKAREVLNKHGTVLQVDLTEEYCDARLRELQLVYEAVEKRKQERDEQREQRAAQKEEERVQRELARAQEEAAKEEAKFEKALQKARVELSEARDEEREAMSTRIAALEADLVAAHDRKERAIAQAQLTRVGHVYIISNLGAFGEGVVKIGMTRRLEPEERVKELGDASVPFPFDLHALIYSEDAPALETRLHDHFWESRLNWSNDRKEFFRVQLSDIQVAIRTIGLDAELRVVPEAREYRETMAIRERTSSGVGGSPRSPVYPDDPFEE